MTITDEQLEQKEREIADLIGCGIGATKSSAPEESQQRIDRILRRIRLENRIQEEAEAAAQSLDSGCLNESDASAE
jgi:hypothetical protein